MERKNIVSASLSALMLVTAAEPSQDSVASLNKNDAQQVASHPPMMRTTSDLTSLSRTLAHASDENMVSETNVSIADRIKPFLEANLTEEDISSQIKALLEDYESNVSAVLYGVVDKLGVTKGVVNGCEVTVIDTSWPVIKKHVENVIDKDKNDSSELKNVREIFNLLKDITYVKDGQNGADYRKTNITSEQIKKIIELSIGKEKLFNIDNMSREHCSLFRQLLKNVLSNWSGFQEISSMLLIGALNNSREHAFRYGFSTLSVYHTLQPKGALFDFRRRCIVLSMDPENYSQLKALEITLVHEAKHAYDCMLFGEKINVPRNNNNIYFHMSPLCHNMLNAAGGAFRELFFPQLSPSKMRSITDTIEGYIKPWLNEQDKNGITNLEKIKTATAQEDNNFFAKAHWLFELFDALVRAGFSDILFEGIEPASVGYKYKDLMTPTTIARAFYIMCGIMHKESCGCYQKSTVLGDFFKITKGQILETAWDTEGEPLAIIGLLPYTIDGKTFLIYTRQNEVIFGKRKLDYGDDATNEQKMNVYRNHWDTPLQALPDAELNNKLQSMISELTQNEYLNYEILQSIKYPNIKLHDEEETHRKTSSSFSEQDGAKSFLREKIIQGTNCEISDPLPFSYYNSIRLNTFPKNDSSLSQKDVDLWKLKNLIFSGEKEEVEKSIQEYIEARGVFEDADMKSLLLTAMRADDADILFMLLSKIFANGNDSIVTDEQKYYIIINNDGEMRRIPVIWNLEQPLYTLYGSVNVLFLCSNYPGFSEMYLEPLTGGSPSPTALNSIDYSTLLHYAAKSNKTKILEKLLSVNSYYDGEADISDSAGYTPLHVACMYDNLDSIEILLKHGANPDLPDQDGKRAADHLFCIRDSDNNDDKRVFLRMLSLVATAPECIIYIKRQQSKIFLDDYISSIGVSKEKLQELESKISSQEDWNIDDSALQSVKFNPSHTFAQKSWNSTGLYVYLITFCPKMSLSNYTFLLDKIKKSDAQIDKNVLTTLVDFWQENFIRSGINFADYREVTNKVLGI